MRKNLLAGIIGMLLVILIAEVTVRLFSYSSIIKKKKYMFFSSDEGFFITDGVISEDHFLFVRDPYLFWRLKPVPNDEFHAVNPQGFRGKEISFNKTKNTYRIFCIGDSCTFGIAVKYYEAYPFFLENLLNRASQGTKYEVINAGVPGYSSFQGLRHLERDILKYKPDLVIASFGWNDTMPAVFYTDKEQRTPPKVILVTDSFLRHFKVYLIIDDVLTNLVSRIRFFHIKEAQAAKDVVRVPKEDFSDNLNKIYSLGRHNNFKVIFINQPSRCGRPHHYGDIMKEFSQQKGIPFLDIEDKFLAAKLSGNDLFIDDNHTTAMGHWLIAEDIFRILEKEGIIKK